MADASIEALIEKIETHDASAVAALSTLTDRCLVDVRNRTLFDVAILSDNAEVIALLASDRDALEFSAPVDTERKDPIKHSVAMREIEVPIVKLETHLERSNPPRKRWPFPVMWRPGAIWSVLPMRHWRRKG